MEELKKDFLAFAYDCYERYVSDYGAVSGVIPYLSLPLSYIGFAREEPQLFKLLFINEMDLDMRKAKDFYRESDNVKRAGIMDDQYDITLLLGPLHHLYSTEDKRQALSEAVRVTKKGGVIFAAYVISDGCLLDDGFHRGNINVSEYIQNGLLDPETFAARSEPKDLFELVRKEDIDELMSPFPVTRLHYVAADGCALFMREAVDAMDDNAFALYLKYHLAVCEREDMVGITSHAVDIFKK